MNLFKDKRFFTNLIGTKQEYIFGYAPVLIVYLIISNFLATVPLSV